MNTPNIRFKGFSGDWEQKKFSEIAKTKRGLTYKPENIVSEGKRVLRSSNINEDTFEIHEDDVFVDENSVNIPYVKNGDILITSANGSSRLVGKHAIVRNIIDDSMVHGGFMLLASSDEPEFVNALMSSQWYTKFISVYVAGGNGAIGNLNKNDLDEQIVLVPSNNEMKKLGEYFSNLDNLITLHQRKCDSLKQVKKYMLQKMFPKQGEKVPEIRFKGFTGDWEQRKFPEFVQFYNGQTYKPEDVLDDGVLVLRSSNVKNDEIVDADNVYLDKSVANAEQVRKGDIIVVVRNGSRALIGKHAEIKREMSNTVIGAFMTGIRSDHSSFVNALLRTSQFEREIEMNLGATINQITGYMFSRMAFMIPSGDEQDKIGAYFKSLDNLITLYQRKVDSLKEIKKFMLQNMFPNK